MLKSVKSTLALIVLGALPILTVAPASAITPSDAAGLQQVFNCSTMVPSGQSFALWDGTGQVVLENCINAGILDGGNTGNASTNDGTIDGDGLVVVDEVDEVVTFTGEAEIVLLDTPGDIGTGFSGILAREVYDMGNPAGSLVIDSTTTIPEEASSFTIGTVEDAENEIDIEVDGNPTCKLEAGDHVYIRQRLHVSKDGTFTFRVTGTDPLSTMFQMGTYTPLDDPTLFLYEGEFDDEQPNSDVVGCNDDFNDLTIDGFDWSVPNNQEVYDSVYAVTEDNEAIEGHFPYFSANLTPGDYTMVVTTYSVLSADDWANGDDGSGTWEPGDGDIDFEIWGPENGIAVVDHFELASTGVNAEFGIWAGLALLGTGAVIAVTRPRETRA